MKNDVSYRSAHQSARPSRASVRVEKGTLCSDALPFDHLLESVSRLLSNDGMFSVIIPYTEEQSFINLASNFNLFPISVLHVKGTPTSEIKRSLIAFTFIESKVKIDELIIEHERHNYTEAYINLTKDFYLKM